MKARRRFPPRAWLYSAAAILILSQAITIVAQTIKGDSAAKVDKTSKWMPWDAVSPAKNPPRPLKSAVQRELNALYAQHGQKTSDMSLKAAARTVSHPTVRSTAKTVSRRATQPASRAARRGGTIGLPKLNFSKLDVSKLELPKVEVPRFDVQGLAQNVFPRKLVPHRKARTATVRRSKAAPLGQPKIIEEPALAANPKKTPAQASRVVQAPARTASHPTVRSIAKTVSRPATKPTSQSARRVGTIGLPKLNFSKLDVSKLELPKVEVPRFDVQGLAQNVFPRKLVPHGPMPAAIARRPKAPPHGQPKHIEEPALAANPKKTPAQASRVVQADGTTNQLLPKELTTAEVGNEKTIQQLGRTAETTKHRNHLHGPFHVVSPTYPQPLLSRCSALSAMSKLPTVVHDGIEKITRSTSLLPRLSSHSPRRRSATGRKVPSPVPLRLLPPRPTVVSKRKTQKADRKTESSAKKNTITKEQLANSVDGDSAGKIQTTNQETLASVKTAADGPKSLEASESTAVASRGRETNPPDKDAENPYRDKLRLIAERRGQKGLKGFCPVALRDERDLKDAKPEFASVYRSHIYHFSSLEAKAAFDESPKQYAPASSGDDVVLANKTSKSHEGTLDHAVWFRNRLYLFTSKVTLDMFVASPRNYAVE